jgi:hypothetical protein
MKIKRWISTGHLGEEPVSEEDLLEQAGRLLDKSCSHEICGEVAFEGEDGKIYVGTVEFCIAEAADWYAKELQEDQCEQEEAV